MQSPAFRWPAEADLLIDDANKARIKLGWAPRGTFEDMIRMMVNSDVAARQATLP